MALTGSNRNQTEHDIHRLELCFEKKRQRANASIKVRSLVATQFEAPKWSIGQTRGEFNKSSTIKESETQLIRRLVLYVTQLTRYAADIHLEDNFVNPKKFFLSQQLNAPVKKIYVRDLQSKHKLFKPNDALLAHMHPEKKNNITCLTFTEFALYPGEKSSGPLSEDGFREFISEMEKLASLNPDNLHLVVGTVPVRMGHEVHNMAIHIQCGHLPAIHPFSKSITHNFDCSYPNTTNRNITSAMPSQELLKELSQLSQPYLDGKFIDAQFILKLIGKVKSFSFYNIFPELVAIISALDKLKGDAVNFQPLFKFKIQQLLTAFDSMIEEATSPLPEVVCSNEHNVNVNYKKNIVYKTVGGAEALAAHDICIEHGYSVAKNNALHTLRCPQNNRDSFFPIRGSYTLISNTISLDKDNIFGQLTAYADPTPTEEQKPDKICILNDSAFGFKTKIFVHPIRELALYDNLLHHEINRYNQTFLHSEAVRFSRSQRV